MPNISEKDKNNVIKNFLFYFTIFSVHSKMIFMYTSVHTVKTTDLLYKRNYKLEKQAGCIQNWNLKKNNKLDNLGNKN